MRRFRRLLAAALIGTLLAFPFCVAILAENSLRVPRSDPDPAYAAALARRSGTEWQAVQIAAADGAALRGWYFVPRQPHGGAVILLHGVADTCLGMLGHAGFLLEHGYTVLLPDSRAHGASGGQLISYGIRESDDLGRWAEWLLARPGVTRLYGLGMSMGAAILLQSVGKGVPFRAVVADCPFASFEEVAYDRLRQISGWPRAALWPAVRGGILYTRWRYGLDLDQASPFAALAHSHTPVLLIHGDADRNIPPRHSRELHAGYPATRLWIVSGAGHVAALASAPAEYRRVVLEWFAADAGASSRTPWRNLRAG